VNPVSALAGRGTMKNSQVDTIAFRGGKPLSGTVEVRGAKNLVTKAMVAALLGDGPSVLSSVPDISDVAVVRARKLESSGRRP